jgi:amino-acid N-acetyltransferase
LRRRERKRESGELRVARASDLGAIERLLESSGLPVEGVREGVGGFFVCLDDGGALLGVVGLELYGTVGLLRSAVVAESARRRGIAAALIRRAVARAEKQGCRALYLLTLDAVPYFQRFGFATVDRDCAPTEIQGSSEFATLCPASAILMQKILAT